MHPAIPCVSVEFLLQNIFHYNISILGSKDAIYILVPSDLSALKRGIAIPRFALCLGIEVANVARVDCRVY